MAEEAEMTGQLVQFLGSVLLGALLSGVPLSTIIWYLWKRNKELRRQVDYDQMTMIFNRVATKRRLERSMQRMKYLAEQDGKSRTIITFFVDMDGMKRMNDQYGHEAVDKVIIRMAQVLSEQVRPNDIVGRMGGDEFLVVLEDSRDHVDMIATRINKALRRTPVPLTPLKGGPQQLVTITGSLGGVIWKSDQPVDPEEVVKQADAAHTFAKRNARKGNTDGQIDIVEFMPKT